MQKDQKLDRLCESCVRDKSRRTDHVGQIASEPKLRRKINRVGNLVHRFPTRLIFRRNLFRRDLGPTRFVRRDLSPTRFAWRNFRIALEGVLQRRHLRMSFKESSEGDLEGVHEGLLQRTPLKKKGTKICFFLRVLRRRPWRTPILQGLLRRTPWRSPSRSPSKDSLKDFLKGLL